MLEISNDLNPDGMPLYVAEYILNKNRSFMQINILNDANLRQNNVDFFIQIDAQYIGLQIKPIRAVSHIPQIYKERGLQYHSHSKFQKAFGGKVFTFFR